MIASVLIDQIRQIGNHIISSGGTPEVEVVTKQGTIKQISKVSFSPVTGKIQISLK